MASAPAAGAAGDSATVSMGCTVRSVDVKARTVEVITGVGYALRLYRMKVAPTCDIQVGGTAGPNGPKPGTIVRIRFAKAPAGPKTPAPWVATSIESVPNLDAGGAR